MGKNCFPVSYDDEWIMAHWESFRNWKKLCEEYNMVHESAVNYNTFKSHCNRVLALNFHYPEEQVEWLRENYPRLGRTETAKKFNETFNEKRTPGAIKVFCQRMGLRVTEDRKKRRAIENTGRFHPVGTVVKWENIEPYIKTESGWKPLKYTMFEKQKGKNLVYLDGNQNNVSKENLMFITREVSARMITNEFWSEDPEITRTGIICCELEQALKENGGNANDI